MITAFNTGMRIREILGLKWEQVKVWDMGGEIELLQTKNGEKRYVPLNTTMRDLVDSLKRESEFVFLGTRGERLFSIKKPLANAIRRAGIEKATAHDFRHSWASWMSETGVDPYTIMEIGSWSSMRIIERYLHKNRAERQEAVEAISGRINSRRIPTGG